MTPSELNELARDTIRAIDKAPDAPRYASHRTRMIFVAERSAACVRAGTGDWTASGGIAVGIDEALKANDSLGR